MIVPNTNTGPGLPRSRLECLDGLRGVLAVYVMLGHMAPFGDLPEGLQHSLSHGGAAVDVFFILSGLVILRSLSAGGFAAPVFLISRAARIFPVYLVMLAAAVAVQTLPTPFDAMPWIPPDSPGREIWSEGWPGRAGWEIVAHLTMTHGLFPNGLAPDLWVRFLGAAWSLSTEWQFYLFALMAGRVMSMRGLIAILLLTAAIGLAWDITAPAPWHFSRAFLPNKAAFFALGIASALWTDRDNIGSFLVVLGVCLGFCGAYGHLEKLLPPLVWTLCLIAQLHPRRVPLVARILQTPLMQWLGAISFPLYLANEPVQKLLGVLLARLTAGDAHVFTWLFVPSAILLPVALAAWLHHAIEIPALVWARSFARRPKTALADYAAPRKDKVQFPRQG